MNIFNSFYANFFTVGALIPTVFHLFLCYVFLSVRNRSKSTFHIGIAYLYLALFNFGYFIAAGFYHPMAAYHRWITVGVILLHETHVVMFMLNLHREANPLRARILLALLYAVSLGLTGAFFYISYHSPKVFLMSAHHWDFSADNISKIIGLFIIGYLLIVIGFALWKFAVIKTVDRYFILAMGVSYLIASVVPSAANLLSRDGVIDRGTFQVLWDIFSLVGLYILVILYLNYTRDRVPLMSKIVSIILVTVLLVMQGFSYYSFQDNERFYDTIQKANADLESRGESKGINSSYVVEYSGVYDTARAALLKDPAAATMDFGGFKSEYRNALVYAEIQGLEDGPGFGERLKSLLDDTTRDFRGYRRALLERLSTDDAAKNFRKHNALHLLLDVQKAVTYHRNKIGQIPREIFRDGVDAYLKTSPPSFWAFREAIAEYLKEEKEGETQIRAGVLSILVPAGAPGQRYFREHENRHFISFLHVDEKSGTVYDVGFPYSSYRKYQHPAAVKFINALFIAFLIVVFGFNLFFRGVLINPLHRLVEGQTRVREGDLAVEVPAMSGDEIGFLTSNFNLMVSELREARKRLDDYTTTLEERYRAIVENINEGYYEVDLGGNLTYFNESIMEILEYSREELEGMNFSAFTDEENARRIYGIFNDVFTTGTPSELFEYPVHRKDGSVIITESTASLVLDAEGGKKGFRGILRNITERWNAEEALRKSEEKYRSILESIREGYFEVDLAGNYTFYNDAFRDIFGVSNESLEGLHYSSHMDEESASRVYTAFNQTFSSGERGELADWLITLRDGRVKFLSASVYLIKNESGRIIGFRGMIRDLTDKRSAEEALRQSEEKYRTVLESGNVGYFEVDLKGRFSFLNNAALNFFGYSRDEMIGSDFDRHMAPDTGTRIRSIYEKIFRGELESGTVEHDVVIKGGETRFIESRVFLMRDGEKNPVGFRAVALDITDRKRALDALRESEGKYRTIVGGDKIGYFEVDIQGNVTFFNDSFLGFVGYGADELIGMNYTELMNEEMSQEVFQAYHSVFTRERETSSVEMKIVRKDGSFMYGENHISLMTDAEGAPKGFRVLGVDITERKRAEEALRSNEERFSNIMRNISDYIFICDYHGRFLYMNPIGAWNLGYSAEEICGKSFLSIIMPEYREQEFQIYIKQYKENIEETYHEYPAVTRDGKVKWASQIVRMVKNADGEPLFYGVARDITEQKKSEDARRELEEQKTRFFANISHEIRTPLTLMLAPIESVLQGDYGNRINRAFFDNLYRNGLRLLKMVNNLLDFSKIEAGRMRMKVHETDMVRFIRNYVSAVHSAAESKGLTVKVTASSRSIPVYLDMEKMDKVFMNLFSNSLKFTENGGSISVNLREDDEHCHVEFRDTGEGIPAASLDLIFDRFSQADTSATRKYEGTGIGLALVKELVEMHMGTITVQSRHVGESPDDHGSVFTVSLLKGKEHFKKMESVEFAGDGELEDSVSDHRFFGMREMYDLRQGTNGTPAPAETEAGEKNPDALSTVGERADSQDQTPSARILIVDDNQDMRGFLSYLLKKQYTVDLAENGKEGLEKIQRLSPDLVITDVMMPVMDGYEMTSLLKNDESLRHIPVIMLTAKVDMSHKLEGLEFGADDYLTKPFNSKELLTRIRTLLNTRKNEMAIVRRNLEIERELDIARLLQQRLLPKEMIDISGYTAGAVYIPMDAVGGDFYDIQKRENFIDIFIADVSGHGLTGAFLSTITKIGLDSIVTHTSSNKTLYVLNDLICRSTVNNNYVTAFHCSLDTHTNVLSYCCAGHCPPLLYRSGTGEFFELKTRGMPLGWFRDIKLREERIELKTGDRLVLYTDGIIECINPGRELYGDDRFREFIKNAEDLSPDEFNENLLAALKEYSRSEKFDDDLTLLVLDVG